MSLSEALHEALKLAAKGGRLLVVTAPAGGAPHISTAGSVREVGPTSLELHAWFCPRTVANVERDPHLLLAVLDPAGDGYQIEGEVERMTEAAMLNGHDPALEEAEPVPQVQRVFLVKVHRVLPLPDRAHSDEPL